MDKDDVSRGPVSRVAARTATSNPGIVRKDLGYPRPLVQRRLLSRRYRTGTADVWPL
jgi:hypothetical protein